MIATYTFIYLSVYSNPNSTLLLGFIPVHFFMKCPRAPLKAILKNGGAKSLGFTSRLFQRSYNSCMEISNIRSNIKPLEAKPIILLTIKTKKK